MNDWTAEDPRRESYPSAPPADSTDYSGQKPSDRIGARKGWVDARNDQIQDGAGHVAQQAAGGGSIGAGNFVLGVPIAKWAGMSEAQRTAHRDRR